MVVMVIIAAMVIVVTKVTMVKMVIIDAMDIMVVAMIIILVMVAMVGYQVPVAPWLAVAVNMYTNNLENPDSRLSRDNLICSQKDTSCLLSILGQTSKQSQ